MANLIEIFQSATPDQIRQLQKLPAFRQFASGLYKTGLFGAGGGSSPISGLPLDHGDVAEINNVLPDQHHGQQHAIDSAADHTGTLTEADITLDFPTHDNATDHARQHAIDAAADHTFPESGGITWLDDEGNWTDPGAVASPQAVYRFAPAPTSTGVPNHAGYSYRQVFAANTFAVSGTKIRLWTINAAVATLTADHVSIGVQDATYNTLAAPVEITFGGGSGYVLPALLALGVFVAQSDWITFSFDCTLAHILITDWNAAGTARAPYRTGVAAANILYSQAAVATYNVTAPAGVWTSTASQLWGMYALEIA